MECTRCLSSVLSSHNDRRSPKADYSLQKILHYYSVCCPDTVWQDMKCISISSSDPLCRRPPSDASHVLRWRRTTLECGQLVVLWWPLRRDRHPCRRWSELIPWLRQTLLVTHKVARLLHARV